MAILALLEEGPRHGYHPAKEHDLLQRAFVFGGLAAGVAAVLKMRGSAHDKRIHDFNIDSTGMQRSVSDSTSSVDPSLPSARLNVTVALNRHMCG